MEAFRDAIAQFRAGRVLDSCPAWGCSSIDSDAEATRGKSRGNVTGGYIAVMPMVEEIGCGPWTPLVELCLQNGASKVLALEASK
ncbi:unnamed protein product, partial [Symbiodinium necroappetens]